jgi:hypothetical protein
MLPTIFLWASRTLIYLQDIPKSLVLLMENGYSLNIRSESIMFIIQSTWYGRVWINLEMMSRAIPLLVTSEHDMFTYNKDVFY